MEKLYWIGKGTFGRDIGYGDQMPADLDEERVEQLIQEKKVTDKKPGVFDDSKAVELKASKKAEESFKFENEKLKTKIKDLEGQLEKSPKTVKEANKKIKDLEKQIEELTKPGGK